ncbi:uncharacterized protein LOC110629142 isoform X2 [Manihot esculenta]|uniref:uncharacterized protein LOC110629142 isoform X2 n=1 Tax=Manihot esculenta TaxID=3983 RepID=UPI000B5D8817|nr:uncharacterized protein LOC110629142 isoform X2 [Manihot esculenta]
MVWNYPDISLEEMMKLIKGFVDIMILASGYQSSGLLAQWDAHNIKKAFQWASFFENVLGQISSSDAYQDSVKELDAALREMTLYPSFPQGLANLSYGTLNRARNFVMAHLFHTLPLRDSHLRAFLTAIIEMDLDKHSGAEHDYLSVYLNRFNLLSERRGLVKDSVIAVEDNIATRKIGRFTDDDLTQLTLEEMFKRQSAVSCISKVGTGLDILSNAIRCCSWTDSDSSLSEEQLKHERAQASVRSADQLVDFITWNRWKSLNLSYFLNNRTVRLVSGASMIFSAPKVYWEQIFERLSTSAKCKDDDDLQEMIELMLLGCITSKWNHLIEYFISVSYDPFTISKLYHEVCSLFTGRYQSSHSKEESTDTKCITGKCHS